MMTSCWVARSSDAHGSRRIDVNAEIPERRSRRSMAPRHVDNAEALRFAVQANVLGDAEIGNDVHLLRNKGYSCPRRPSSVLAGR